MSDYKLSFIIDAQNKAKATLDQVKGQMSALQKDIRDMEPAFKKMALVGTAGFAAITAAVGLSIRAAADSERQWAIVARQISLAGLSIDDTLKSTQEFASSIQSLTGFSDEYVGMLVGRFLPSVKNLDEAKRMARIALDMEASGMVNAETAARALMVAREGDIMMLRRYVPALRGLDSEMLENLSTTEKYELAMGALEKQFGGLAETAGTTFTGQLNILRESFGDLQERIGEQFIPILTSLLDKVRPVIDRTMEWIEKNPELTKDIILATGAVTGFITTIGILGLTLPSVIEGIKLLTAAITGMMASINWILLAIVILVTIWQNWDTIVQKSIKLWNWFLETIGPKFSAVWEMMKPIWETLRDAVLRLWERIKELGQSLWRLFEVLSPILMPILKVIAMIIGGALFIAVNLIIGVIILFVSVLTGVVQAITFVIDIVTKVVSWLTDFAGKIWEVMNSAEKMRDVFIKVWEAIEEAFKPIYDRLANWIGDIISKVQRAISLIKEIGGGVGRAVGRVLGGGQFGIPMVPRTGLYMLHRGETVSPAGRGGSITININGGYYLSEAVAEDIGDTIIRKLKRTMKI